ncbi:MAG: ribosomal protein S18-alanine N-acetyltransferase [Microthrixaceae bacterium]
MRRRHLRGVVAVEEVSNPTPWSAELFANDLRLTSSHSVVAVTSPATVVGFGCVSSTGFEAHVTNLGVDPSRRGTGIGAALLVALLDRVEQWGHDDITLEVRSDNTVAIALYERFGFVAEGVRPGYYSPTDGTGRRHDAVIMWARGGVAGRIASHPVTTRRPGYGGPSSTAHS